MKSPKSIYTLLIMLGLMVAGSRALPAQVLGSTFGIGGFSATVGQTGIEFNCTPGLTVAPCPAPDDSGNFLVDAGTDGIAAYFGQGGFVGNISEGLTPLNVQFLDPNWLIFSTTPGNPVPEPSFSLDLTFIQLGTDAQADCFVTAALNQSCTPVVPQLVGSPNDPLGLSSFNLQNTLSGFTASFTVDGIARQIGGPNFTGFTGTFTATVDGESYQDALQQILDGTAPPFTYTASFALVTPEPNYVPVFAGLGMLAIFCATCRRRRLQIH